MTPHAVCTALLAAAALSFAAPALAASGQYVNMGSSYASGPGIGERAPGSVAAYAQSAENYAHVLAAWRGLDLMDVSCSGATTHDILSPNGTIPAQVEAVTAATELVTVLIGGNDVGYVSTLLGLSCQDEAALSGQAAKCSVPSAASVDAALAAGHDICASQPWVFGYSPPPAPDPGFGRAPYHPNGAAHSVIAIALDRMLFPQ